MAKDEPILTAGIPMKAVGPVRITGPVVDDEVMIPLATFESPLWPSTDRGAKVSCQCGGITAVVIDDRMTRSILVEARGVSDAAAFMGELNARRDELAAEMQSTSRFAELIDIHTQIVGSLVYIRFEMKTGDAAGHNMVTAAADRAMQWILAEFPNMKYVSISGNYCTDKKASAVNGILGRGKYVVAELTVPRKTCSRFLKTTPEQIVELNVKKNLLGTMLAGGVRSANAHFANMLLGFYLATGQDAANIVEGSQGFVFADMRDDALYFSVTLPNIIVGTAGSGKDLAFVEENLRMLGCLEQRAAGANARRLAVIAAAAVLCGELSLLAAQTNPGELMDAHLRLERRKPRK
ncbi:MAG: hydroxymethylglutaryl-CoA reductase [Verrucomicrobia bacterium]|nr:hydroxymethylglutaryl-CoA reductase [Verrucomicrobiota bacterium]